MQVCLWLSLKIFTSQSEFFLKRILKFNNVKVSFFELTNVIRSEFTHFFVFLSVYLNLQSKTKSTFLLPLQKIFLVSFWRGNRGVVLQKDSENTMDGVCKPRGSFNKMEGKKYLVIVEISRKQ